MVLFKALPGLLAVLAATAMLPLAGRADDNPASTTDDKGDSRDVQWVDYTNHIFGFAVEFPSFLHVEENYKHAFWKREHGRRDLLQRGIELTLSLAEANARITITARECDDMEDCRPGQTEKGPVTEVQVDGVELCRYAYIDYAMGGKWGVNVWYRGRRNGVCYRIGYFGFKGAVIGHDGQAALPESEDKVDLNADPGIFDRVMSSFRLVERRRP